MLRLIATRVPLQAVVMPSRILSSQASTTTTTKKTSGQASMNDNVPGLSENCVKVPNAPVGPGASKDKEYKNPEYFCYHMESFGEAEVELAKYRLPPPSNKVPFTR